MVDEKKIYSLVALLAVILALMGVILVFNEQNAEMNLISDKKLETYDYVEITSNVSKASKRTNIVTSDYVRDLDSDANLVIMTEDGSAYVVRKGNVMVDDRVVTINDEEKSVYYINEPVKSVSSN